MKEALIVVTFYFEAYVLGNNSRKC